MAKRGVHFIKQDEPAFLKRMKQQAGYKEGPTIDTKRKHLDLDPESDDSDRDDEKPQVVVLKSGDLTENQVRHEEEKAKVTPREVDPDAKILFKRPTKQADDNNADDSADDNNSAHRDDNESVVNNKVSGIGTSKSERRTDKKIKKSSTARKVKNNSLLSFAEDDEEDNNG